jgi:hypothetical protein
VAPHEDQEDSRSYYSEHSDEDREEIKEAYKVLYVEFLKLRKTRQQHVHELNSLQTEKSSILMQTKELDMLIIHVGMELKLHKTLYHFLVAQLQDLGPNVLRKH